MTTKCDWIGHSELNSSKFFLWVLCITARPETEQIYFCIFHSIKAEMHIGEHEKSLSNSWAQVLFCRTCLRAGIGYPGNHKLVIYSRASPQSPGSWNLPFKTQVSWYQRQSKYEFCRIYRIAFKSFLLQNAVPQHSQPILPTSCSN